jgi:hypothetical protein
MELLISGLEVRVLPGSPNVFNELGSSDSSLTKMDYTLEMRQLGWAHFAGKGLQSETEAILAEVSADGR